MQCRRFRRLALLAALVAVLLPALLWVCFVLIVRTDWARGHVLSGLQRGTGRDVQLDRMDVCLRGNISLGNLRIASPRATADPWLRAERIEIDVSPLQLLCGRFEPSRLEVDGASLRVLRRADGSLELAELVEADAGETPSGSKAGAEPHQCGTYTLTARLTRASMIVIDEATGTRISFDGVHGEAALEADGGMVVSLSGQCNQGPFQLTGHLDRATGRPNFDGQFMASDVALDQGMNAIRYAVPVLAGAPLELKGRLATNVYLSGRGRTGSELCRSLKGRGSLSLDPVSLDGTPLVTEFAKLANHPAGEAIGSIKTDFVIQENRIRTENLALDLGRIPVNVTGWTDFGGALDYQVKLDGVAGRLPEKAREYLSGLDLDVNTLTSLHLTGTVDRVAIRPMGVGPNGRAAIDRVITPQERQRLKVLGRQIRDKLLR
ncbi:MAG: AsmA-like C-terminal region-containing protein [Isosphaeraceae bacterium]